ncbi:hypothetical protein F8388_018290 [Cannabis sativa]|uniref:Zinc knuckle CX2CX4HX4C domain-containing protein n=1 Tax=Cannabis sativa TaxID=3483 RepID=A0A7J6EJA3_CANSA|nr:hypothetical protein F8388_018290 [Cannabis sativa]
MLSVQVEFNFNLRGKMQFPYRNFSETIIVLRGIPFDPQSDLGSFQYPVCICEYTIWYFGDFHFGSLASSMEGQTEEFQVELCGLEDFKISLESNPELGVEAIEKSVVARLLTKKQEAVQITRNGPWLVCDGFLVVKPMLEDGKWSSTDLNSTPIWVRVHEMPPRYWTLKNANALAQKVGSVISIDRLWRNGFSTNEYVRFQVSIQLNKPIMVGVFLPMEEGVSLWCYFKYENMPCVCYKCGVVGHDEVRCRNKRRMIADDFNKTVPMYDLWIRLGSHEKDYFSNYKMYEQERLNREWRNVHFQAEARQNLVPGEENFKLALIGTEIHMEAVVVVARRQSDDLKEASKSSGIEAEVTTEEEVVSPLGQLLEQGHKGHSSPYVHGKEVGTGGEVLAHNVPDSVSGPGPSLNSKEKNKESDEVDNHQVEHLAIVFKALLGSNSKSVHKHSRPIRSKKEICLVSKNGPMIAKGPLWSGKKRRLDSNDVGLSILGSYNEILEPPVNKKFCPRGSKSDMVTLLNSSGDQEINEDFSTKRDVISPNEVNKGA